LIHKIVAVGKLREKYWQDAASDYVLRLRPYARIENVEIVEARIPENASPADERKAMYREALAILDKLKRHSGPVIVLDRQGRSLDSKELAAWLEDKLLEGQGETAWVIGGPLGLAPSVLERADLVLSFSRMTFPHQLMRVILLEQIFRSFRIMHHEPYHK
jgi:23S rRNA (pseudouridine1915-N3)-methyltransferase